MNKRTKIVCTMGPACDDEDLLREMIKSGMNVARFNFSHGSHEEMHTRMERVKRISRELGIPVGILLDTKGPEIRTGLLEGHGKVVLEEGSTVTITAAATSEDLLGTSEHFYLDHIELPREVNIGGTILIDDGLIGLTVTEVDGQDIICTVQNGGELGERKGVNVPNAHLSLPTITEQDRKDILFGIEEGIDFVAASFIRDPEGVREIRRLLDDNGGEHVGVFPKIECAVAVYHFDEILKVSDGIMVARGDLGVEIPAEEVPYLQKMLIQKCNSNFKTVITATQMLDSMMRNPRPTRAEVTDVANAVYDGTDAVMLSGETAQGKYPLEALQMMVHIIESTEQHLDYETMLDKTGGHLKRGLDSAVGYSSVLAASNLNAKCIITPSVSGATTRVVSNLRPRQLILGVTPNERTLRRMSIYWGVVPIKSREFNTTDDICDGAIELAKVKQYVETGDVVVLTAGIPSPNVKQERSAASNMMRIATVE